MVNISKKFSDYDFPDIGNLRNFSWIPILFRPRHFSPEQFVMGVFAFDNHDFFLSRANNFDALSCFFQASAPSIISAANFALDVMEREIERKKSDFANSFISPIFGVSLGELRSSEGESAKAVAQRWNLACSALYKEEEFELRSKIMVETFSGDTLSIYTKPRNELELGRNIMEYVTSRRPRFERNFNPIFLPKPHPKRRPFELEIDYTGTSTVASFSPFYKATLISARRIKQRMWDLTLSRRHETSLTGHRRHTLFVQISDDAIYQEKNQVEKIKDSLLDLEKEGANFDVSVFPFLSGSQAGEQLIKLEN
ncbi:MAG: hypothetical protein JWR10_2078 [Rubritepida sp.]|nr:hypothetical protein [Rubritepida sp.]